MNSGIEEIIKKSTFKVEAGRFIYAKVSNISNIDNHFMVSKDADEITVVTKEENIPGLILMERNKDFYRLIALNVSVPFYAVGFIATISQAIAKEDMNVLIISTYSKDYIIVRDNKIENVKSVLLKLGLQESK